MTYQQQRLKPDLKQVQKIKEQLGGLNGLRTNKKIDYVFDGVNSWEKGYNISTLALGFDPEDSEMIDGIEYPTTDSIIHMKKKIKSFRESTQCRRLVLYPNRGENGKGEWRYFNMQNIDEWNIIEKLDNSVIKSIKRWIKMITTLLRENPEYRNEEHKKEVSEIRYELMLRRRMLRRLEKKKLKEITVFKQKESQQKEREGESEEIETNEG